MAEASAPEPAVTVCRLVADDWQAYRSIRLDMLQESPAAFGSTYAQAAAHDEDLWRQRLTRSAVFLARLDQEPAGSAVYSEFGVTDPGDGALFGMWVDPAARGSGVGRALVAEVVEHARSIGKRRVLLDVVDSNEGARELYERCGFEATGHTSAYPNDDQVLEIQMQLLLVDAPGPSVTHASR